MGDAGITEESMTTQEIEKWVEDALDEMDDELCNLFSVMTILNKGVARLISEVGAWKKLHRCFNALNLFVIPIVLSIGIAYGALGIVEQSSILEILIMFLMCLSMFIGFPLYIFNLWNVYVANTTIEKALELSVSRVKGIWKANDDKIRVNANDSGLMLPVLQDSIQRFSEIGRSLSRRIKYNMRLELESLINRVEELESTYTETMENYDNNENPESSQQDLDSDFCLNTSDLLSERIQTELFQMKENESRVGVNIFVLNDTQELTVEVQKEDVSAVTEENKEVSAKNDFLQIEDSLPGIRNIAVENVSKGLKSREHVLLKGEGCHRFDGYLTEIIGL